MISLLILVLIIILIGGGIWAWPLVAGALGLSSVTDKAGALRHIAQLMNTYGISPGEVETAFNAPSPDAEAAKRSKGDIAKTLFAYLGAIFILSGIGTYIGMFWNTMGSAMRILVTLGVGYILLIVLVSALHEKKFPRLILPLSLASAIMMTNGWFVFIHEIFPRGHNWRLAAMFVFGIMAVHQGLLFGKYRRTVLAFTGLFFVYGFLNVALDYAGMSNTYIAIVLGASIILVGTALEKTEHRTLCEPALLIGFIWLNSGLFDFVSRYVEKNWSSVVIGVSVMMAAYGMQKAGRYPRLIGLGYFIGSVMAYAGLFDLVQNTPYELVYLAVTASILYACVVLQSRALLLTTVIAMLGFIGYFSEKHFAHSLGWPVTLVLMGVAFLGIGALAMRVKRRM